MLIIAGRRKRRNLASAFVGEVSAIMALIEEMSQPASDDEPPAKDAVRLSNGLDHPDFLLPRCDLYAANAGKLDLFDSPLPSQLSHFYTRVASLPEFLRAHASPAGNGTVTVEFEHILVEGEDLLRNLRPFVSKPHSPTFTRA